MRYEITGEPLTLYACHCSDCQKQSASAFGLSLILHPADFEFTAGTEQLRHWDTRGEDGSSKSCHFCAVCGTRLLHGDPAGDEPVSIKGGSLDRTDDLEPIAHLWLRSAQPWIEIDRERYACFDTEPDSWASLMRRWQARSK